MMHDKEGGESLGQVSAAEFERVKTLGLALYALQPQIEAKLRDFNAQEDLEHQGIPALREEVKLVADTIAAMAKRVKDPQALPVSWEEFIDIVAKFELACVFYLSLIQFLSPIPNSRFEFFFSASPDVVTNREKQEIIVSSSQYKIYS